MKEANYCIKMGYQKKGYTSGEIAVAWIEDWDKLSQGKKRTADTDLWLTDTTHTSQWVSSNTHAITRSLYSVIHHTLLTSTKVLMLLSSVS